MSALLSLQKWHHPAENQRVSAGICGSEKLVTPYEGEVDVTVRLSSRARVRAGRVKNATSLLAVLFSALSACKPEPADLPLFSKQEERSREQSLKALKSRAEQLLAQSGLSADRQLQVFLAIDGTKIDAAGPLSAVVAAWAATLIDRLKTGPESRVLVVQLAPTFASELLLDAIQLVRAEGGEPDAKGGVQIVAQALALGWLKASVSPLEFLQGLAYFRSLMVGKLDAAEQDTATVVINEEAFVALQSIVRKGFEEDLAALRPDIEQAIRGASAMQERVALFLRDVIVSPDSTQPIPSYVGRPPLLARAPGDQGLLRCITEGAAETYDFMWESGGSVLGEQTQNTLVIDGEAVGAFRCAIRKKGTEDEWMQSAEQFVGGSHSGGELVRIDPGEPDSVQSLSCLASWADRPDGSEGSQVLWEYQWIRNGTVMSDFTAAELPEQLEAGDVWQCAARRTGGGSAYSFSQKVRIRSAPPVALGEPELVPSSPTVFDAVSCRAPEATDPDGDLLEGSLKLLVNGEPFQPEASQAAAGQFRPGDVLRCDFSISDGQNVLTLKTGEVVVAPGQGSVLLGVSAIDAQVSAGVLYVLSGRGSVYAAPVSAALQAAAPGGPIGFRLLYDSPGSDWRSLAVAGARVMLSDGTDGSWTVLDSSGVASTDPAAWSLEAVGTLALSGILHGQVRAQGDLVSIRSRDDSVLYLYQLETPGFPLRTAVLTAAGGYVDHGVQNGLVFGLTSSHLHIYDPAAAPGAELLGSVALSGAEHLSFTTWGPVVSDQNGLHLVDVTDPGTPVVSASLVSAPGASSLSCAGKYCLVQRSTGALNQFELPSLSQILSLQSRTVEQDALASLPVMTADVLGAVILRGDWGLDTVNLESGDRLTRTRGSPAVGAVVESAGEWFVSSGSRLLRFDPRSLAPGLDYLDSYDLGTSVADLISWNGQLVAATGVNGLLRVPRQGTPKTWASAEVLASGQDVRALAQSGEHLIAATGAGGITIYSAEPAGPVRESARLVLPEATVDVLGLPGGVAAVGVSGSIYLVSWSDPRQPALTRSIARPAPASLVVRGDFVYSVRADGLEVFQFDRPSQDLILAGSLPAAQGGGGRGLALLGRLALLSSPAGGVSIVDVSSASQPDFAGRIETDLQHSALFNAGDFLLSGENALRRLGSGALVP